MVAGIKAAEQRRHAGSTHVVNCLDEPGQWPPHGHSILMHKYWRYPRETGAFSCVGFSQTYFPFCSMLETMLEIELIVQLIDKFPLMMPHRLTNFISFHLPTMNKFVKTSCPVNRRDILRHEALMKIENFAKIRIDQLRSCVCVCVCNESVACLRI